MIGHLDFELANVKIEEKVKVLLVPGERLGLSDGITYEDLSTETTSLPHKTFTVTN